MQKSDALKLDEIGYWSEIKLDILAEYAKPYNRILKGKGFTTVYIDAFAGAGHHIAKGSDRSIQGSPVRALSTDPPFDFLHFVDMDKARTEELRRLSEEHSNVQVHQGDANLILPRDVFPQVAYEQYRRGLCILDPYSLNLDWSIIEMAGKSKAIEIFLNFPVMDMNRNAFWKNPESVKPAGLERMNRFWGDDTWKAASYSSSGNLFGHPEKLSNEDIAKAFQKRLKTVAGFGSVPDPIPMRNSKKATVYYLFFAAQQAVASNIVTDIFKKYKERGS